MLYLEDFLELLENLPSELRDRFTDIRTLDLQVQNGLDVAENAVDELFRNLQSMMPNQIQPSFEKIKEDYKKILENADEKVNLATLMHDLVKKYLSKLDQEVSKFKIELEADSPGITEALEKKVKETERIGGLPRKEKIRKRKRSPTQNGSLTSAGHLISNMTNGLANPNNAAQRLVSITTHHQEAAPGVLSNSANFKKSQSVPYRLADTSSSRVPQQTVPTALTPNKDKMNVVNHGATTSGSGGFLHSFTEQAESRHGRPRKLTSRVSEMLRDVIQKQEQRERLGSDSVGGAAVGAYGAASLTSTYPAVSYQSQQQLHHNQQHEQYYGGGSTRDDSDQEVGNNDAAELSDQSDQQRWCICNRVSFGNMVACDDKDCPFEWFHYECVGITQPPKGKWFCPHCTKRRK